MDARTILATLAILGTSGCGGGKAPAAEPAKSEAPAEKAKVVEAVHENTKPDPAGKAQPEADKADVKEIDAATDAKTGEGSCAPGGCAPGQCGGSKHDDAGDPKAKKDGKEKDAPKPE